MAKPVVRLTIREAADRLGEDVDTVKGWRRRGCFPNAELTDTPRGPVWTIPESDLNGFERPKVGRPHAAK
ncbi:MAG: helix-turn-helix domain-containing protein [Pyrinomonadaceae bacterium]